MKKTTKSYPATTRFLEEERREGEKGGSKHKPSMKEEKGEKIHKKGKKSKK